MKEMCIRQSFSRSSTCHIILIPRLVEEEPSLNLCDVYLFDGPRGKAVMTMTVNPDMGLSAPDTLHPEVLYAFRFDLNGDAREELHSSSDLVNRDTDTAVSMPDSARL